MNSWSHTFAAVGKSILSEIWNTRFITSISEAENFCNFQKSFSEKKRWYISKIGGGGGERRGEEMEGQKMRREESGGKKEGIEAAGGGEKQSCQKSKYA